VAAVRFSESTLGWLMRDTLLIVVVGDPTGLSFAVDALVDSWAWTVVIVVLLAAWPAPRAATCRRGLLPDARLSSLRR
jgi:hypothetical protein